MNIGNQIKKLRELRNLTQKSVANELNLSQKQYSRIENNQASPTIVRLKEICKVLQVSLHDLIDFSEQKIFNKINNQHKIKFGINSDTELGMVKELYEKLLEEKERTIKILQSKIVS